MVRTRWESTRRRASRWRSRKNGPRHAVEMTRRGKRGKVKRRTFPLFPPHLEIRPKARAPDFHIPTASTAADSQGKTRSEEKAKPDRSRAIKTGHLDKLTTLPASGGRAARAAPQEPDSLCPGVTPWPG